MTFVTRGTPASNGLNEASGLFGALVLKDFLFFEV